MEEQKQTTQNIEPESQIHPDYQPIPHQELPKKRNWTIFLGIIIFVLIILGVGYIIWSTVNKDELENENTTIVNQEPEKELSAFEKERLTRMQENCKEAKGTWQDGECRTGSCQDSDAFEGNDDKYVDGYIQYVSKNAVSNQIADRCETKATESVVKEMTCNEEEPGYFVNSFVEYECENGCDDGACKRLPYDEAYLYNIMSWIHTPEFDLEIEIRNNGIIQYLFDDHKIYRRSVVSEEDYKELQFMLFENDDLFEKVDDFGMKHLEDSEYLDKNLRTDNGYVINYIYYQKDEEGNFIEEDYVLEGSACNISCPQNFLDIIDKIIEISPKYGPEPTDMRNFSPNCNRCDDNENPETCWTTCLENLNSDWGL